MSAFIYFYDEYCYYLLQVVKESFKLLNSVQKNEGTPEKGHGDESRFILIILSIINYIHTDMFIFVLYLQNNQTMWTGTLIKNKNS